jgi:hypothetical protein
MLQYLKYRLVAGVLIALDGSYFDRFDDIGPHLLAPPGQCA